MILRFETDFKSKNDENNQTVGFIVNQSGKNDYNPLNCTLRLQNS